MRSRKLLSAALILLAAAVFYWATIRRGDPGVQPRNWLDLKVLDSYPNPHADTCSMAGTTQSGRLPRGEKLAENLLKNRYLLPSRFTTYNVTQMLALPSHEDVTLENSGVTLIGFVSDVKYGGSDGESCNCNATAQHELDTHIEIIGDPHDDDKHIVIAETTERSRRLAAKGLLSTNIGNDWSTQTLRQRIEGHWVKISGWLFYDPDHEQESWGEDENDSRGQRNWRGSSWEVHPVLGIEILPGKPSTN